MFARLVSFLRKLFNKDEYRVLGIVVVLSGLLGAALGFMMAPKPALGFAAVPRWLSAAIFAVGTIPISLVVGVWFVLLKRSQRMLLPRQMATVYRRGGKNVLACLIGFLVMWLLIAGTVWRATGEPIGESFGIALVLLWGIVAVWWPAAWFYDRQAAGPVLLDCGPHPCRRTFPLNAMSTLFLGLTVVMSLFAGFGESVGVSAFNVFWIAAVVLVVSSNVETLMMTGGRLQVRENGIWQYWSLLRWAKIESYQWADDGTWLYRVKGFSFLSRGALPVPPEYKDAFDQLLQKHCAAEAGKRA